MKFFRSSNTNRDDVQTREVELNEQELTAISGGCGDYDYNDYDHDDDDCYDHDCHHHHHHHRHHRHHCY